MARSRKSHRQCETAFKQDRALRPPWQCPPNYRFPLAGLLRLQFELVAGAAGSRVPVRPMPSLKHTVIGYSEALKARWVLRPSKPAERRVQRIDGEHPWVCITRRDQPCTRLRENTQTPIVDCSGLPHYAYESDFTHTFGACPP
jgi:hypothetical protein